MVCRRIREDLRHFFAKRINNLVKNPGIFSKVGMFDGYLVEKAGNGEAMPRGEA